MQWTVAMRHVKEHLAETGVPLKYAPNYNMSVHIEICWGKLSQYIFIYIHI